MEKQSANKQYLAAIVVSLLGTVYGIVVGWSSPSILLLTSDQSPLSSGKITLEQASWVTSLKSLGFLFTSPVCGIVANKFGRKWPLFYISIPSIISWILIWYARDVYYLYIARLLQGIIGAGFYAISQCYLIEISNDNVRGAVGSSVVVSCHIGLPIAFALGTYFSFAAIPICSIALSVLFCVSFFFLPETPLFLVKRDKLAEAEKSIRFYRNLRGSDAICDHIVQEEIEKLKLMIGDSESKKVNGQSLIWNELKKNPGRKATLISVFLAAFYHFSGSYVLINYTATIFEAAGSVMSSNESALVVGIIQFVGTIIVPLIVDCIGRKILYILSTIGSIFGYAVLGLYMMFKSDLHDQWNWVPIVTFSFIVLIHSFGISTLLYAVAAEILPESLREFGISLFNAILGSSAFVVLKLVPFLIDLLGFSGMMFLFCGICIPGLLIIIFYIPETKCKSYDEIMELLK